MSGDVFTPDEVKALKAFAAGMINALGRGGGNGASNGAGNGSRAGIVVASDNELDSQHGNPTIRKDPKRWAGQSYEGVAYAECPSDYLLVYAESLEYFAQLDEKKPPEEVKKHRNGTPWHVYNRKDAALARGWAARNGTSKPTPARAPTNGQTRQQAPAAASRSPASQQLAVPDNDAAEYTGDVGADEQDDGDIPF